MRESDLYPPVKRYLEGQGYEVKGEVLDCDVLAVRASEAPVVVELKLSLSLQLVLQCVERLDLTDEVYLAVPSSTRVVKAHRKRLLRMLRMLGLGLITVDVARDVVDVQLDPGPYRGRRRSPAKRARLLREFEQRVGDPNRGGMDRRKGRVTAFRQRAVVIGRFLQVHGPSKASNVAAALGDPKARDVLYRNVYGWFDRMGGGVYTLSPRGCRELAQWPTEPA